MTTRVVADDVLATYLRREWDLRRRLLEGTLIPETVLSGLQMLSEGQQFSTVRGVVANINLLAAYDAIGLLQQYEVASKKFDLSEEPDFWKLLMLPGVTSEGEVKAYRDRGLKVYCYREDLDTAFPDHDRDPNKQGPYVVKFRRRIEADKENKNQSARHRRKQKYQDGTLPERLVLGRAYLLATSHHLDVETVTQCPASYQRKADGSRGADGNVPKVNWYQGREGVYVDCSNPGDSYEDLCARSAFPVTPALQAS